MSTTPQPLVRIEGLTKTFVKDGHLIEVLRGVDLTFERADSVAIMGRSGAGKSTFLQVVGTLERPTAGRILFDGEDPFAYGDARLASFRGRSIGFVFQFHHLLPEFNTLENAAMPALIARVPRSQAFDQARVHLDRVGLSHRLTHRPGELSGGEQQRVALARALIMKPKLLLADEPTGNLDDSTGRQIFDLFRELGEEAGVTVVVVTHNPSLAALMKRKLVMTDGRFDELSSAAAPGSAS